MFESDQFCVQMQARKQATVVLQSLWRGRMARHSLSVQHSAASHLQRAFRQWRAEKAALITVQVLMHSHHVILTSLYPMHVTHTAQVMQ